MSGAGIAGLDATLERLRELPGAVQNGLARALARASLDLQAEAQGKLSGSVLRSRTGALRDSILATVSASADGVSAAIGSDLPYAGGTSRRPRGLAAFGRPLRSGSERIAVGAYDRKLDYPAHSFLRSALADREPEIMSDLEAAVTEAVTA